MAVSKETAAALAAKYPHLAAQAADAEPLEVLEQFATVQGIKKLISRHQKFRLGHQTVSLRAPEAPPAAPAPVVPVPAPKAEAPAAEVVTSHSAPADEAVGETRGRTRK